MHEVFAQFLQVINLKIVSQFQDLLYCGRVQTYRTRIQEGQYSPQRLDTVNLNVHSVVFSFLKAAVVEGLEVWGPC
ncbi:hypothetical protein DPMN_099484 [Dreissena polymorpha]|uniref:Uncharacterized protein n=1 Tax=Dreissena polymorpha TaxID=45954 RepID=A0A9D4R6L0_DREPO|nr:hypothetical protein DPMN_099484 [Dreissena polymorpha]